MKERSLPVVAGIHVVIGEDPYRVILLSALAILRSPCVSNCVTPQFGGEGDSVRASPTPGDVFIAAIGSQAQGGNLSFHGQGPPKPNHPLCSMLGFPSSFPQTLKQLAANQQIRRDIEATLRAPQSTFG